MPHKRDRSPYYYCRRRALPGYGDTGRLTSKSTSKRVARDMERLLDELAQRALMNPTWYELLDAVCRRRTISLPELLKAKHTGSLEALKRSLHDPLLSDAVNAFKAAGEQKREVRIGLDHLTHYAEANFGKACRLSAISSGKVITELCLQAERGGRKRNSVRRYMLRAISLLLRHQLGAAERDRIFADVHFAGEDDTREVHLSPAEIASLLQACETHGGHELAVLVRLALQTSADRGVLLAGSHQGKTYRGLRRRDVRVYLDHDAGIYSGEVFLPDSKTKDRTRTVPLTDGLCRELIPLCHGKNEDDPVFSLSYEQLDFPWKEARRAAGLSHVRFKDLRAQISIYGEEADVPLTVLSKTMGHGGESMTRRYQQRRAALSADQAESIERAMLGALQPPVGETGVKVLRIA